MQKAKEILKKVFGYEGFRPLQEACIQSVLDRKDTLLIMPTGGGKSLCYQIPSLIFEGLTLVVSPLISLMTDQVRQLRALGVETAVLNSSLSEEAYEENLAAIRSGRARLLFLAPETLLKSEILELVSELKVDCFTIDEAHCISEWGHDFRPEYRQLSRVRAYFPKAVFLAMTATATPRVREDIRKNLEIAVSNQLIASFNRENLFYEVIPRANPAKQTIDFINRFPDQSGIIYCFSRRQTDELAEALQQKGYRVKPYHAGLPMETRAKNQELFIRDDVQIMVATIAFGMGIHKPNVRFVVHYDLPKNIESYYQETGRAGRDGLPANCLLLFGYGSIQNIRYLISQKTSEEEKRIATMHLNSMVRYAESHNCRRIPLITYFGQEYGESSCAMCDNCANPKVAEFDITESAQKLFTAIRQTGHRFGAAHVIDVLRGAESQKVLKFSHEKLSVYGTGKEYSGRQWNTLLGQLIQQDYLKQDHEAFGAIKMTPKCQDILNGETSVFGFFPPKEEKSKAVKKAVTAAEFDDSLFQILRRKRKELADEANLPPYVIFSDKSLIDMAARLPQNKEDFSGIFGVGAKKLESYGDIFLGIIRDHRSNLKVTAN